MWGATVNWITSYPGITNFNPRTPCGVRPGRDASNLLHRGISIHAPRVGCDVGFTSNKLCNLDFNPRTPCGVRRYPNRAVHQVIRDFNPRTPCGVRPVCAAGCGPRHAYFNPRTPCGVRRPPRVKTPRTSNFNPRTPCGVRHQGRATTRPTTYFNPRTPCGVRHNHGKLFTVATKFQSTHPVWGATPIPWVYEMDCKISIHAPRVGCDGNSIFYRAEALDFNPRTPCGVRLDTIFIALLEVDISIHAPRVGCDTQMSCLRRTFRHFNPRTPCGVRRP